MAFVLNRDTYYWLPTTQQGHGTMNLDSSEKMQSIRSLLKLLDRLTHRHTTRDIAWAMSKGYFIISERNQKP